MKHTPGPWAVEGTRVYGDKSLVATAGYFRDASTEIGNVHLISAAPDLLAALEALMPESTLYASSAFVDKYLNAVVVARSAIAKAKGDL